MFDIVDKLAIFVLKIKHYEKQKNIFATFYRTNFE